MLDFIFISVLGPFVAAAVYHGKLLDVNWIHLFLFRIRYFFTIKNFINNVISPSFVIQMFIYFYFVLHQAISKVKIPLKRSNNHCQAAEGRSFLTKTEKDQFPTSLTLLSFTRVNI